MVETTAIKTKKMDKLEITEKYKEISDKIEELKDFSLSESDFDDLLDEIYEPVQTGQYSFNVSSIWYNCDRVLYNIAFSEEEDRIKEDLREEINDLINEFEFEQEENEAEEEIKELKELLAGVY